MPRRPIAEETDMMSQADPDSSGMAPDEEDMEWRAPW